MGPFPLSAKTTLKRAAAKLREAGVESPSLCAQVLLAHVLGTDRLELIIRPDKTLSFQAAARFDALIAERGRNTPVAYLTGKKEFFGLELFVDRDVLVPRPETEGIVEEVLRIFPDQGQGFVFADICTGSGALAVALCSLFPNSLGIAVDISRSALGVAEKNARKHGVARRLHLACSDLGSGLASRSFDLVVANPPYVSAREYAALPQEIRAFEPARALWAGEDGLRFYPGLASDCARVLKPGGTALVETGSSQGAEVLACFREFPRTRIIKDLAGLDRIVAADLVG
ncbi:MAG: peptide chain release factor N(5)-glutamine methyltransferase [Desulfonatronovibrionaceae bacterium]